MESSEKVPTPERGPVEIPKQVTREVLIEISIEVPREEVLIESPKKSRLPRELLKQEACAIVVPLSRPVRYVFCSARFFPPIARCAVLLCLLG